MQSNCARLEWMELHISHSLSPVSSAERLFSHHTLGSLTSRAAELPCSPGSWAVNIFHFLENARLEEIPPSLRTRFALSTPLAIRIWWLQGEGQHRGDSAAGSSFAMTASRSVSGSWPGKGGRNVDPGTGEARGKENIPLGSCVLQLCQLGKDWLV